MWWVVVGRQFGFTPLDILKGSLWSWGRIPGGFGVLKEVIQLMTNNSERHHVYLNFNKKGSKEQGRCYLMWIWKKVKPPTITVPIILVGQVQIFWIQEFYFLWHISYVYFKPAIFSDCSIPLTIKQWKINSPELFPWLSSQSV